MGTVILSVLVVAVSMAAMAIGVAFGRRALLSGCHCTASDAGAAIECEGCPHSQEVAARRRRRSTTERPGLVQR